MAQTLGVQSTVATGAVTLLEAAKAGNDVLKKGVIETIIQESPIAEQIPWMTIQGNAFKNQEEATLPTVEFRRVNETYDRSFGTDIEIFWGTTIMGGEVYVDNYLAKVRGNVYDVRAHQYQKVARATALTLDKYIIDGTGASGDFKGVNQLISDGIGFNQVNSTNGAALTLSALEDAEDNLRKGGADAIWLNRFHRTKITRLARTGNTYTAFIDVTTDMFGRRVNTWNGVPMRIIGDDQTGTAILGFDETCGNTSANSSIYFVKFGTDFVCGLLGLGGSFDVRDLGEMETAPGTLGRIEFYPGLAIFDKYSVVRLTGITKA